MTSTDRVAARRRTGRGPRLAAALALVLAGCAAAPPELVREGERKLAQGDHAGAAVAFDQVLRDPRATALDRTRAQVGEARAFLARGDLVGARTRFRRIDDAVSDKWYYLGVIAVREGDLAEAEVRLRGALERAHGGDTAARLARVMAGEARTPDPLEAAAATVERRSAAPLAEALRVAAAAWRELVAGAAPGPLLERLAAVEDRVGEYPSVRVLRARLLERAGETADAAALWDLAALSPPPSEAFRAWASELRASLALESGDAAALDAALSQADPETAARVRADLAASRLRRGDSRGALEAWRQVIAAPTCPPARRAEALAAVAWLEDALGLPTAEAAWTAAAEVAPSSASALARVARRRAAQGDLLGGAGLVSAADPDPGCVDIVTAARLLDQALRALEQGRDDDARRLARALRQLDPGGPAGAALQEALGALTLGERTRALQRGHGATRAALERAALRMHLALGDASGVTAILDRPDLVATLDGLGPELEAGVLRALAEGRAPEAIRLLERHAPKMPPSTVASLRAGAPFRGLPDAVLPTPRDVTALPEGERVGALVLPSRGRQLARVLLGRRGPTWWLVLPWGTRIEGAAAEVVQALGEPLEDWQWTAEPGAGRATFDELAEQARGERHPVMPILSVR